MARPIGQTLEMIEELQKGHLNRRLQLRGKDEISRMGQAMDQFADDLQTHVVGSMKRIAHGDIDMTGNYAKFAEEIGYTLGDDLHILRNGQRISVK